MNPVEKKWQTYQSLRDATKVLLAKEELGAEDVATIEANNQKMDALQAEIAKLEAAQASMGRHDAVLDRPVLPVPLGGPNLDPAQGINGTYATGVNVLGLVPDGYMVIDGTGKKIQITDISDHDFRSKKAFEVAATADYHCAYRKYLQHGWPGLSNTEQFTLQEGVDSSGGYLAPVEILNQIISKKPTPTRVQNYVTTFTTGRDSLAIPKVVYGTDDLYTTGMRVTWTGEVPTSSTASRVTDPVFGAVRVPVYTAMMSIPVTRDLLEDAMFDLDSYLSMKFGETIELLKDNMILNGTGLGQPLGILANPGGSGQPAVVTMGNPITADGVVGLGWNLPEQYDDEARFVFNKTNTGQAIAKLKDSQNRYIWGQGYQDSGLAPSIKNRELLGYPVNYSGFMPNTGANNYPVIFGDFHGYALVNRVGFSIQVLRELYAETNQVLLLGRVRFGGQVFQDWTLKIGQQA